jgi:formylmethanofuran dehydrogenase subunit E
MTEIFKRDDFTKCIIQENEWENKRCSKCGRLLSEPILTDFGEIKICNECGNNYFLFKKIPINKKGCVK